MNILFFNRISIQNSPNKLHNFNERGAWKLLVVKPEGKRPVGRPRRENYINHDLREIDYTGGDWKSLAEVRDV